MQEESQSLLINHEPSEQQINIKNESDTNNIRQIRLKKELEFLKNYDYQIINNQTDMVIVIKNLWGFRESLMYGKELKVFLPEEYPFKQPTFKINDEEALDISEILDHWSPKFKIMEMIELIKKRLEQKNEIETKLKENYLYHALKSFPSLSAIIFIAILLRVCVGFGSYSGKGDWPNLGDFEAHRNWMSITVNRPITKWYVEYDNEPWWRIDYPPIAAYISYIFGAIYQKIEPEAMLLQEGYETPSLVAYMRATVLLIDCLILIPALYLLCSEISPIKYRNKYLFLTFIFINLIKPDQILIDHGHFQYNSLMLGLILLAFYCMITGRRFLCCFLYTLAINCKLMSVYFSLAFFAGLIGLTFRKYGPQRKEKIIGECIFYGGIVLITTLILWLPWMGSIENFTSVLHAIFPVHRGLYQLKVSNFWCISDILLKWQSWLSKPFLTFICFIFCIVFSLPSMVALILKPTLRVIIFGFSCISMTFFMFSYHVHEKSILVPLCMIPFVSQYLGGSIVMDLVIGGTVNMYHLLKEDGQKMQYFVVLILYIVFATSAYYGEHIFMNIYHFNNRNSPHAVLYDSKNESIAENFHKKIFGPQKLLRLLFVFGGIIILHLGELWIAPPASLPFLWNLLFAFYSFVLNSYFLIISNWILIEEIRSKLFAFKKE